VSITLLCLLLPLSAAAQSLASPGIPEEVTFTEHVAPILYENCVKCHRPGGVAPMSLTTYEEARPWAPVIKYKTGLRDKIGTMPPYYLERDIGIQQVKDDERLSEEQLQLIASWADNGALEGNPENLPPLPEFSISNEWRQGEPDLIVPLEDVFVGAGEADSWVSGTPVLSGLLQDRYVSAVDMREGIL
jgi:hypothetical protein